MQCQRDGIKVLIDEIFYFLYRGEETNPTRGGVKPPTSTSKDFAEDALTFAWQSAALTFALEIGLELFLTDRSGKVGQENLYHATSDVLNVNGVHVQLTGVQHDVDNFFNHREEFRGKVDKAPFVVLEYFNELNHKTAKPSIPDEQLLLQPSKSEETRNFFAAVGRDCASAGKDIFVVNPLNYSILGQLMEVYLMLGLPTTLILTDVGKLLARLEGRRVPRRHLLRTAGYGISAGVFASWVDMFKQIDSTNEYEGSPLRWNSIDYRDVRSAQGIQKITELYGQEVKEGQIVPIIQGAGHTPGFMRYLENPSLADTKMKFYKHYELFSNPIQRYSYNSEEDKWELKQEIVI